MNTEKKAFVEQNAHELAEQVCGVVHVKDTSTLVAEQYYQGSLLIGRTEPMSRWQRNSDADTTGAMRSGNGKSAKKCFITSVTLRLRFIWREFKVAVCMALGGSRLLVSHETYSLSRR